MARRPQADVLAKQIEHKNRPAGDGAKHPRILLSRRLIRPLVERCAREIMAKEGVTRAGRCRAISA